MWGARLDTGHRELLGEAMAKLITSVRKRGHFRTAFIHVSSGQERELAERSGPEAADATRVAPGSIPGLRTRLAPLQVTCYN